MKKQRPSVGSTLGRCFFLLVENELEMIGKSALKGKGEKAVETSKNAPIFQKTEKMLFFEEKQVLISQGR